MDNTFLERDFTVLSADSTCLRRIKPSSVLKYFQAIEGYHSDSMGNGYHALKDRNMALICYRTSMTVVDPPKTDDEIKCKTWLRKQKGAQFIRDYLMTDREGNVKIEATTSWILMNLKDRVAIRPNKVKDITFITNEELALSSERMGKIKMPENMEFLEERKIKYTDLDHFFHLNNCVYADIISDALGDKLSDSYISKLDITYEHEAKIGDVIIISTAQEDNTFYVCGDVGDTRCFDAKVEVTKIGE